MLTIKFCATQAGKRFTIVALITVLMLSLTAFKVQSQASGNMQVSFIDVGQGDSALIQDPGGFDVLIDGGTSSAGQAVANYLRGKGVDDVDVLVATHPDADHIGGLIDVLLMNDIPVEAVVYNGYPGDTETWFDFLNAVSMEGLIPTVVQYPQSMQWGELTAHVLNPVGGLSNPETNDASLVLRVDYHQFNMLFAGDIDTAVEAQVVARETPLGSEILKVAHHGSAYGSSTSFLDFVDPLESIISVGNNGYGHPAPDALSRIAASGSRIWRTDQNGNITIVSDGQTYTISAGTVSSNFFLPIIIFETPPPTPVPTTVTPVPTTPTPTTPTPVTPTPVTPTPVTPTPVTPTPETPTEPPTKTSGNVQIISIFVDGAGSNEPDEYVEIKNLDASAIQLQNWTLRDNANHVFTFPGFVMQPNQVCRVYTNQNHPESCGFNYASASAIWNNGGDCAYLRDAQGTQKSQRCY